MRRLLLLVAALALCSGCMQSIEDFPLQPSWGVEYQAPLPECR